MNREDPTQDILNLERKYWRAVVEQDIEAATALTDFPCLLSGPRGARSVDKATFTRSMKASSMSFQKAEIDDSANVRMLSDDVAIIAYEVREEMTADGEKRTVHAVDSSTWVRRDGHWRCAMHAEAIKRDA